jgi:hypothetical protein
VVNWQKFRMKIVYIFGLELHCLSQLVDKLLTTCWQLATRLLSSTDLLQVVPTTCCYRPAIQQFVNKLWVTTLWQLDKTTALLQLVDKLATSLLRTHLVDQLWDLYVCRRVGSFLIMNTTWILYVLPRGWAHMNRPCKRTYSSVLVYILFYWYFDAKPKSKP